MRVNTQIYVRRLFVLLTLFVLAFSGCRSAATSNRVKEAREVEALTTLTMIRAQQQAYKMRTGACAPDLKTLGFTLTSGGTVGNRPAEFRYSTDINCDAVAKAGNPGVVVHPFIRLTDNGSLQYK